MGAPAFLDPDRYPHGTRARYVAAKCRCTPCRAANTAHFNARRQRAIEQQDEIVPNGPPGTKVQMKRDAGGHVREFRFSTCPGVLGVACPRNAFLRNGRPVCATCRDRATVFDGPVSAERVRKHLLKLRRKGIGYKSVAAACDVGASLLLDVVQKRAMRIRASTERRVLAVDEGARADASLVPAAPTLKLIDKLINDEGLTRRHIARLLGKNSRSLQFLYDSGDHVLARTALQVAKLYRQIAGEEAAVEEPDLFETEDDRWKKRLADAYLDGVSMDDLVERFNKPEAALRKVLSRAGVTKQHANEVAHNEGRHANG